MTRTRCSVESLFMPFKLCLLCASASIKESMVEKPSSNQSKGGDARAKALSSNQRAEIARKAAAARWGLPTATHEGPLGIAGWVIPSYNLPDGRRLLSQRGFMEVIDMRGRKDIGHRLGALIDSTSFKSASISKLVLATQNPIKFFTSNGVIAHGYEGEMLIEYCKCLLEARRMKALHESATPFAEAAERFVVALAGVGIAALIDAATGYEKVRDRKELEALLDRYLRHEFSAWAKRFPDEFYHQIARLKNWQWSTIGAKRPSCVGNYTNDLVYARLEIGILKELQLRNPWIHEKKRREGYHHTLLTDDFGIPALAQHLHTVIMIMRGFSDGKWDNFKEFIDRAMPRKGESVQELLSFYAEDLLKAD
jgi:hypothetical protein